MRTEDEIKQEIENTRGLLEHCEAKLFSLRDFNNTVLTSYYVQRMRELELEIATLEWVLRV